MTSKGVVRIVAQVLSDKDPISTYSTGFVVAEKKDYDQIGSLSGVAAASFALMQLI